MDEFHFHSLPCNPKIVLEDMEKLQEVNNQLLLERSTAALIVSLLRKLQAYHFHSH